MNREQINYRLGAVLFDRERLSVAPPNGYDVQHRVFVNANGMRTRLDFCADPSLSLTLIKGVPGLDVCASGAAFRNPVSGRWVERLVFLEDQLEYCIAFVAMYALGADTIELPEELI